MTRPASTMISCPTCARLQPNAAARCDRCNADLSHLDSDPLEGRPLAGFALDALIGAGAMGKVYRGTRTATGEAVAVKVLHHHLLSDRTLKARFQREALAASRLDHASCIRVLDFGEAETGDLYIAMEHLSGLDLADVLERDFPLPFERLLDICSQICEALTEAHSKGIIHRDLKPENIFLVEDAHTRDRVKVLDFGIAKIQTGEGSQDSTSTRLGRVAGTPEYMAPEQARNETLDPRTDLYAFGVTLYLLFSGRLPFTGDSPLAVVTEHLTEPPPDPRLINPDVFVPDAVADLILQCLAKRPEGRPDSAAHLERLLRSALREPVNLHLQPQRSIMRPMAMRSGMFFQEPLQRPRDDSPSSVVITDATGEISDIDAFGAAPTAGIPHALFHDLAFAALRGDTTDEGELDEFGGAPTALHAAEDEESEERTVIGPHPGLAMEPTAPLFTDEFSREATIPHFDLDAQERRPMRPLEINLGGEALPHTTGDSEPTAPVRPMALGHAARPPSTPAIRARHNPSDATSVGLSAMASDSHVKPAPPAPPPAPRGLSTGKLVLLVLGGVALGILLGMGLLFFLVLRTS